MAHADCSVAVHIALRLQLFQFLAQSRVVLFSQIFLLALVTEGQSVDFVGEIKRMTRHVQALDCFAVGVAGYVEIARNFVDYDGPINPATFFIFQCLKCILVD